MLWCSLSVADLMAGMEEVELHCRCRGRSNLRKIRRATIYVRMVTSAKTKNRTAGWTFRVFFIFVLLREGEGGGGRGVDRLFY